MPLCGQVGFFPSECVEVIGEKVPPFMVTVGSPGSSDSPDSSLVNHAITLTPLSTPATARKPCNVSKTDVDYIGSQLGFLHEIACLLGHCVVRPSFSFTPSSS